MIQGRDKTAATTEWRDYISSRTLDAAQYSREIQAHWQIENSCHWVLAVVSGEDASRVRRDHGAQKHGLAQAHARKLDQAATKGNIKLKRKRAGWNDDYMATCWD